MIASGSSTWTESTGCPCRQPNASSGANRQTSVTSFGFHVARSSAAGVATTLIPWIGSSSRTEAFGIVERGWCDDGLAPVDLDPVREWPATLPAEEQGPAEQG